MIALRVFILLIALAAAPAAVQAQTWQPQSWQPRSGTAAFDPHSYQADQHRAEIARLRTEADQREAVARQLAFETRLNRQRLEAARLPEPVLRPYWPALRSPEQERALRRSASERRATATSDLGQIDAWLDRPRD